MIDQNKHRFYLFQILKEVYSDKFLAGLLGFKGGTALLFFHDLPRFSVDLDFNLLDPSESERVYTAVKELLKKFGRISDEAIKHHGLLCVLDYGMNERKLKVEISNRQFGDQYELRNLMGINVKLMVMPDMFAHKLCAMLDRSVLANRDIFDCWFFMQHKTPINRTLVEKRTGITLEGHLQKCILALENMTDRGILNGLGELMDVDLKKMVKQRLRVETIQLLQFYAQFPITTND